MDIILVSSIIEGKDMWRKLLMESDLDRGCTARGSRQSRQEYWPAVG